MKEIIIATPSGTGMLPIFYIDSLLRTLEEGRKNDIIFHPLFIAHDALIQRARNDLFKMCYEASHIDEVIFIDDDMNWEPSEIFKLLSHNVDVVAGVGRKKSDQISYAFSPLELPFKIEKNGLIKIDSIGFAFLKLNRKVINDIWENSLEYKEDDGKSNKMIFQVEINKEGNLISEDIFVTRKIRELGYDIWLDPNISIGHFGNKNYQSDFLSWMEYINDSIEDENVS